MVWARPRLGSANLLNTSVTASTSASSGSATSCPGFQPFDELLEHGDVLTLYRRMLGETWAFLGKRTGD